MIRSSISYFVVILFFYCLVSGCNKHGCPAQESMIKEQKKIEKGKMPKTESGILPPAKKRRK